jgi:CRP/FNR family transcriptional regulator, cyclic AMP receptor protein
MHLTKKDRVELFGSVWLFERCSRRELDVLQRAATELDVEAGRSLATQGELGREFIVIVSGKAEVTRDGTHVADLGAGSFFGEMSLLDHEPRAATVTTTEPTHVLVMSANGFDTVVTTMPSVDRKMLTVLAQRLRDIEEKYVPGDVMRRM